jgi:steroid delta-isomerase-like uncharacterized protein
VSAEDVLRRYLEGFSRSDVDALASLYAPTMTYSNPFSPEPLTSPEAVRTFESPLFAAFGDIGAEIDELVVDGDRVAARVTIRGRHTGTLESPAGPVAATGKTIVLHSAEFLRTDGEGRIVDHHRIFDTGAFMAQLGLG